MLAGMYSAASAMSQASRLYDVSAHNIANGTTEDFRPLRTDGSQGAPGSLDLPREMVDNMLSGSLYALQGAVLRTGDEMLGTLLDVRA